MKATIKNITKALEMCAKAHHSDWEYYPEEWQFCISATTIPVVADIRAICEAFYGDSQMVEVETSFGWTNIYLDEEPFLSEVRTKVLELALPAGSIECFK